ncbi:6-aminohexanoate-cyclic-dimer hydrolase [Achromobacter aegrifaciens]|uniref:amidase n=1 Tax=Achromobacter aegrifaciens TaxID=1287736 RepID=UPI0014669F76|nr:amidase [Achromobacter aegrifaciens]CAB3871366.1 6-aminohexanoate-cyclic-dimer hydrolase [Achromobacter aegrifaciens]
MSTNLAELDAVACAELIKRGEVSAVEMVEAAIGRVEQVNGELNAVIHPRFEKALTEARAGTHQAARFHGVPMLIKDLDGFSAGDPYFGGARFLKELNWKENEDSTLFTLLKQAGFIFIGKTNTPEFGTMTTTEPLAMGPTHNPYKAGYSTGGSSGGSAASVAARMVPLAHGGDGGGSLRVPASECGIVGLKPSRGRVSLGPFEGEGWAGCVARGVMTRSVRDSAAVLDIIAKAMPGDPYGPLQAAPAGGYEQAILRTPQKLKVGMMLSTPGGQFAVDPEVKQATIACAGLLESLGYHIEEAHPAALDSDFMMTNVAVIIRSWTASALDAWGERIGRPIVEGDIEPINWEYYKLGKGLSAVQYVRALENLHRWSRDVESWWNDYDLLITPTVCSLPPPHGAFRPTDDPWDPFRKGAEISAMVRPSNVTGQPAMSVPIAMSASGLPIGVQMVAAEGREDILLAVAAALEKMVRWNERRPPICAA